jgi:hypothetical protein
MGGSRPGDRRREADIRNIALVFFATALLAGCDATTYASLYLPMEATPDSVAARRRPLTEDEKQMVSDAVAAKVKGRAPLDYIWSPLVMRPREGAVSYCGLARGSDVDTDYMGYSKYYARLTLDKAGKVAKVDVTAMVKNIPDHLPTTVDSRCAQDGYGGLPATR